MKKWQKIPMAAVLFTSLILILPPSHANVDRNIILVKDGITVEEEIKEGQAFPITFGKTRMNASVKRIGEWIRAVHTFVDWQHNCIEAQILTKADGSLLIYNRVASPWPVSDRDVLIRSSETSLDNGGVLMKFGNVQDSSVNVPRGVVRMVRLVGSYRLTPSPKGGTDVIYTLDSDPGGKIPAWLVKQASKDLPYKTLKNLRERAESGPPPVAYIDTANRQS
ncbi:MAG: hypothetical protein JKY88_12060 [Pseudomonadales bacterium]|nr:hypothetical protein [Pseudomonadales bacterium]